MYGLFRPFFSITFGIVIPSTELRVLSLFPRSRHTCSLHTFLRHILVLRHILFLSSYPRVFLIRSGRPNGKGGISVRDSPLPHFLPLYIDCLIDHHFLSSSCHYLMLSSSCHYVVIIRYVYLIIPQDVLIYGVRVSLLTLLLPLPLPITYAWHYFIEHSPPYHSALPAIFVTHRYRLVQTL